MYIKKHIKIKLKKKPMMILIRCKKRVETGLLILQFLLFGLRILREI